MQKAAVAIVLIIVLGMFLNCSLFEPDPEPAKLQIAVSQLDFGEFDLTQSFLIDNTGEEKLNWSITSFPDWLRLSQVSGTDDVTVTATADREMLDPGVSSGDIEITSNAGSWTVPVSIEIPLEFLQYDYNKKDCSFTVGQADGILWVRFTRPSGWMGCVIRKVELNMQQDSTALPFDIVYQDDYYYYQSKYYPQSYTFDDLLANCTQNTELKQWDVDKVVCSSKHFFVGIRVSSADGPFLFADGSEPYIERSGTNFYNYPYNRIMLITDINLHCRVYVSPSYSSLSKTKTSAPEDGVWFDSKTIDSMGSNALNKRKLVK